MIFSAITSLAQDTANQPSGLTTSGWVTMILSIAFVLGLVSWCYTRILTAPSPTDDE